MKPINSSNIHSVGYDNGKLSVKFHSGATWDYECPEELHTRMMAAHDAGESVGKFFHAHVRNKFAGTKREESK